MLYFDLLATPQSPVLVFIGAVLALLVGSFLNVVIYRLPVMLKRQWRQLCQEELAEESVTTADENTEPFNLVVPRSRCNNCGHLITWYENIPVFSYLFLRGRCHHCHDPISLRYPSIELLTALLGGFIIWQYGFSLQGIGLLLLTWSLIALTFIDIDHQLLPDNITLPLLWLGLLFNLDSTFTSLSHAVIGAIAGYMVLWCVFWLFKLVTGKEGMGYGDFKLLAAIGAWGGFEILPLTILLSSVVGAVLGVMLMMTRKHQAGQALPFGPYLAIAGWIAIIWGDQINAFYLQFSGL